MIGNEERINYSYKHSKVLKTLGGICAKEAIIFYYYLVKKY